MKKILLLISIFLLSTALHANRMVEAEYLEKMSQYHQDGIEKSKLALTKSQNKEVKKIAQKIINDQTKEKKQLEKLRAKLYADVKGSESPKLPGLKELQNASGVEFDKLYLDLMAKHHSDEIVMTSKMLPEINRDEVHHMAVKIAKNKGNKMDKIKKIQSSL